MLTQFEPEKLNVTKGLSALTGLSVAAAESTELKTDYNFRWDISVEVSSRDDKISL